MVAHPSIIDICACHSLWGGWILDPAPVSSCCDHSSLLLLDFLRGSGSVVGIMLQSLGPCSTSLRQAARVCCLAQSHNPFSE